VGTTGVIFGLIAIGWLAYLVPHFVRRREGEPTVGVDPADRFSDSVRIIRHGTAPLLDQDLAEIGDYQVSTPQTRRAAIRELRRLDQLAATRRRRVLLSLLATTSLVLGLCGAQLLPWWVSAVPGGLLVAFVVISRVSVRVLRRSLDGRYAEIAAGSNEQTVRLTRTQPVKQAARGRSVVGSAGEKSLSVPAGGLWDPVPITMPTYVSKPLAPRTVRTIDLSGADPTHTHRQGAPVTADAPVSEPAPVREGRPAAVPSSACDEARAASA
jgi:hypothetical protein